MTRVLNGVHHSARPTWKLRETVEFYRDILGLPLVHMISARGWGSQGHPDFLHFFFDSGNGSTIAFFYYIGTERPEFLDPRADVSFRSTHTAWRAASREDLVAWREHLQAHGVAVSPYTRHEIIESIYFHDPNGYEIEITAQLREFRALDAADAQLTMAAAIEAEAAACAAATRLTSIDPIWRRKAQLIESCEPSPAAAQ